MKTTGDSTTDVIKLTLHNALDADVIEILERMPRSKKARMIVDAIRFAYGEGKGAKQAPSQVEAKAPEPEPVKAIEPEPEPSKTKRKVKVDAF